MTLNDIEQLALEYERAVSEADALRQQIEGVVAGIKRRYITKLRDRASRLATAREALYAAIEQSPDLWAKPRTRVFHGVQCGLKKHPGVLSWEDDEKLLKKIRQYYVDEIGVLIKTVETPRASALAQLPPEEQKQLGIALVGSGDKVVLKMVAGDLDKLVRALVGNVMEDDER